MKAIATKAQVSQALLHYHFGSKDKLYAEVIRARSKLINDRRLALLKTVDFDAPDALAQALTALYQPTLGLEGGGKAYARIFGRADRRACRRTGAGARMLRSQGKPGTEVPGLYLQAMRDPGAAPLRDWNKE